MAVSGVAGYYCMGWWHDQKMEERKRIYVEAYNQNRGDQHGVFTSSNNLSSSSTAATSVNIISSDARDSVAREGGNNLVSLARKLTHRIVTTSHDKDQHSSLQRQVTKFW